MQVSTWMPRLGVGPTVGVFMLFFFNGFYELFCMEYHDSLIIIMIERCMVFHNLRVEMF